MPKVKNPKVIVYCVNDCHHCDVLLDILRKHRVKFKEVWWKRDDPDIDEKFKKLTEQEVSRFPVTQIDDKIIISLDLVKIDLLLGLTKKAKVEEEVKLEELTE